MSVKESHTTTADTSRAESYLTGGNHAETLNKLKGSRVALESFLDRYAESQATRIEALAGIEWLDRIVGEAALGNFDRLEMELWMDRHRGLAESRTLSEQDRTRISSLLLELQSNSNAQSSAGGSDDAETADAKELRRRFETWKKRSSSVGVSPGRQSPADAQSGSQPLQDGASPDTETSEGAVGGVPRKIVLRRRSETADTGLFERFTEQVWTELDLLYREFETGEHALIKLDHLLGYAEARTDPMYLHLAGSLIYFLKIEGFRMAPYVERLRKAEKRLIDGGSSE